MIYFLRLDIIETAVFRDGRPIVKHWNDLFIDASGNYNYTTIVFDP